RIGKNAVATVEPTIRPPRQAVEDIMLSFQIPAVQRNLGRTVRPVVAVAVGDKQQPGRRAYPDAAKADLQAGDVGDVVAKHLARIEAAAAVAVFEDAAAIVPFFAVFAPVRIGEALGDPEPAAIVKGK